MNKSLKLLILILILSLSAVTAAFAKTVADPKTESAGPGVANWQSYLSPRIPAKAAEPVTDPAAESETVPEAESEDGEGAEAEVTKLPVQMSFEEKVAADLLLTKEERPMTGELFHSDHFFSSSATISISNMGTDDTVIKFYSEDDELVFSVFVRAQEKLRTQIPGGTYKMRQAFGENWYGNEDLFGNCGRYCICTIGDVPTFTIKRSGKYVISTMGQGDAFSKVEIPRDDF